MLRDYQIVSPSLEGVLDDALLSYDGLKRPVELMRVLDGPAAKGKNSESESGSESSLAGLKSEDNRKVLEMYFHDLYGVFMKKLSYFMIDSNTLPDEDITLQAMLQEMLKVKKIMMKNP